MNLDAQQLNRSRARKTTTKSAELGLPRKMMRSLPIVAFFSLFAAMAGCAAADTNDGAVAQAGALGSGDWDRQVQRPEGESAASSARSACQFHRGAMPAETIGKELPVDNDNGNDEHPPATSSSARSS